MSPVSAVGDAPWPIADIAAQLGLSPDDVEPCGRFTGKLEPGLIERTRGRARGHYVEVTAITPTPLGEGKTVVTIGLAMALCRLGRRAVCTLREPSLAPVLGIKGGGAGGGQAALLPADDINLHFTGDLHAVASANNLLAAMVDNHVRRGLEPQLAADRVTWRRCLDINDKGLAHIITGLDDVPQAPLRETGFDLTAASEVMAILALADDLADLRRRLGRIVVGAGVDGAPVSAESIGAAGAMAALLKDAVRPNLVQTCEHTPALVHAGPFANIAHGNSSVAADRVALALADYVVTESGFGADCGAEKFFHIKCRACGLRPAAVVLVCTIRALKLHSGRFRMAPGRPLPEDLLREDINALRAGGDNLQAHVEHLLRYGVPVVIAINRFPTDTESELAEVRKLAGEAGVSQCAVVDAFSQGGAGGIELAEAVIEACREQAELRFLYPLDLPLDDKLAAVATQVYGAAGVDLEPAARQQLRQLMDWGFGNLPVCIAKTPYSLSHDPTRAGRPRGFRLPIREVRLSAGAGFVYALAGDIVTLPGLPREPAARSLDVSSDGRVVGMR